MAARAAAFPPSVESKHSGGAKGGRDVELKNTLGFVYTLHTVLTVREVGEKVSWFCGRWGDCEQKRKQVLVSLQR